MRSEETAFEAVLALADAVEDGTGSSGVERTLQRALTVHLHVGKTGKRRFIGEVDGCGEMDISWFDCEVCGDIVREATPARVSVPWLGRLDTNPILLGV